MIYAAVDITAERTSHTGQFVQRSAIVACFQYCGSRKAWPNTILQGMEVVVGDILDVAVTLAGFCPGEFRKSKEQFSGNLRLLSDKRHGSKQNKSQRDCTYSLYEVSTDVRHCESWGEVQTCRLEARVPPYSEGNEGSGEESNMGWI